MFIVDLLQSFSFKVYQVPLTHRGFNTNHVHFCVGQSKAKSLPDIDWAQMASRAMSQTAAAGQCEGIASFLNMMLHDFIKTLSRFYQDFNRFYNVFYKDVISAL